MPRPKEAGSCGSLVCCMDRHCSQCCNCLFNGPNWKDSSVEGSNFICDDFCNSSFGRSQSDGTAVRQAFKTPEYLKSLYLLMHKYIRHDEDIERAGKGTYSPGLRDDAQDARNSLFSMLNQIPGKESFFGTARHS